MIHLKSFIGRLIAPTGKFWYAHALYSLNFMFLFFCVKHFHVLLDKNFGAYHHQFSTRRLRLSGLDAVVGPAIPRDVIPDSIRGELENENYELLLITSEYKVASDEVSLCEI